MYIVILYQIWFKPCISKSKHDNTQNHSLVLHTLCGHSFVLVHFNPCLVKPVGLYTFRKMLKCIASILLRIKIYMWKIKFINYKRYVRGRLSLLITRDMYVED